MFVGVLAGSIAVQAAAIATLNSRGGVLPELPQGMVSIDEFVRLKGIWTNLYYRTDADAISDMGQNWTIDRAEWCFGKSGRA